MSWFDGEWKESGLQNKGVIEIREVFLGCRDFSIFVLEEKELIELKDVGEKM